MPKREKKKTGGVKNADRRNGKAWGSKRYDDKGRALTGRGKPTGRSIKGSKVPTDCGPRSCSAVTIAQWNVCACGLPATLAVVAGA